MIKLDIHMIFLNVLKQILPVIKLFIAETTGVRNFTTRMNHLLVSLNTVKPCKHFVTNVAQEHTLRMHRGLVFYH